MKTHAATTAVENTGGMPAPLRAVALHSLGWLVAANLVGVWMGVSLLWPEVGNLLAPLTFGRWAPLHLNWQLYGWCSLPVVGALLTWCLDAEQSAARRHAQWALSGWSVTLALGGLAWLGGTVTGKLFLDWHGWARPLLPLAMLGLWGVLAWHTRLRWSRLTRFERGSRVAVLGILFFVPGVLFWSTSRAMYQSVNPDSGGATGAAVLGSTLGIITIFMLLPEFLGVKVRVDGAENGANEAANTGADGAAPSIGGETWRAPLRRRRSYVAALAVSWLVFAVLDRKSVSHHVTAQIVSLATLLAWVPLLPLYWRCYAWPDAARPWLRAAAVWWSVLVVTGWLSFLPGISEALKFTHALVGHAHLAMAALITSVNAAILVVVTRRAAPCSAFWLWQAGCAIYIGSMMTLGIAEAGRQAELFRGETWTQLLMGARLVGGLAMATGSVRWLVAVVGDAAQAPQLHRSPDAGGTPALLIPGDSALGGGRT